MGQSQGKGIFLFRVRKRYFSNDSNKLLFFLYFFKYCSYDSYTVRSRVTKICIQPNGMTVKYRSNFGRSNWYYIIYLWCLSLTTINNTLDTSSAVQSLPCILTLTHFTTFVKISLQQQKILIYHFASNVLKNISRN